MPTMAKTSGDQGAHGERYRFSEVNMIDEKKLIEEIKKFPVMNGEYDERRGSAYRTLRWGLLVRFN